MELLSTFFIFVSLRMIDNKKSICIVCNDAGGAEILSSFVLSRKIKPSYCLTGPALSIFKRKIGHISVCTIEHGVNVSDVLLCGTSWRSELEWKAFKMARKKGKKTIAFLDHWGKYRNRFIRKGQECLPDEIVVGDSIANNIAKIKFPNMLIHLIENPYFVEIKRELALFSHSYKRTLSASQILYVCEPIREHAYFQYGDENYFGYVEEDALRYFLSNVNLVSESIKNIVIRPHPSERPDKYTWILDEYDLPLKIVTNKTLVEQIALSDVVVGCESMAMFVGLLANKRVISSIPPTGNPCVLPQKEIEKISELSNI
jgi:hypothetical protein